MLLEQLEIKKPEHGFERGPWCCIPAVHLLTADLLIGLLVPLPSFSHIESFGIKKSSSNRQASKAQEFKEAVIKSIQICHCSARITKEHTIGDYRCLTQSSSLDASNENFGY